MSKGINWQIFFASRTKKFRIDIYKENARTNPIQLLAGETPFVTNEDASDNFSARSVRRAVPYPSAPRLNGRVPIRSAVRFSWKTSSRLTTSTARSRCGISRPRAVHIWSGKDSSLARYIAKNIRTCRRTSTFRSSPCSKP